MRRLRETIYENTALPQPGTEPRLLDVEAIASTLVLP
jgi:hypothetical protein